MWVLRWLHKLFHSVLAHVLGQSFLVLILFPCLHSVGPGLGLLEDSPECFLGHFLEQSLEQLPHDFRDVGSLSDSAQVCYTHNIGHWPMNGLAHSLHILGVLAGIGLEGYYVGSSGYQS